MSFLVWVEVILKVTDNLGSIQSFPSCWVLFLSPSLWITFFSWFLVVLEKFLSSARVHPSPVIYQPLWLILALNWSYLVHILVPWFISTYMSKFQLGPGRHLSIVLTYFLIIFSYCKCKVNAPSLTELVAAEGLRPGFSSLPANTPITLRCT
jgi:hypothetical protein